MISSESLNRFKIPLDETWDSNFTAININSSEQKRMRFTNYNTKDYFKMGTRWGPKLSFYYDVVNQIDKKLGIVLHSIINYVIKNSDNDEDKIKTIFADIGRYCKVKGDDARIANIRLNNDHWKYFINLEMFGDYASSDIKNLNQGLEKWLLTKKDIKLTGDLYDMYYKKFDEALIEFFKPQVTGKHEIITLKQFIKRIDLWSTAGSAGNVMKMVGEEFKNKFVNTKKGVGYLISPEKIYEKVLKHKRQRLKVNIKRELVKSRGVVNVDLYTYIIMSYLSYYFEPKLIGMKNTPLFSKRKSDILEQLNKIIKNSKDINVPMDQSTFDANVDHTMVRHCWTQLKNVLLKGINVTDVQIMTEKMDQLITNGDVVYIIDKKQYKRPFINGIPSGWRWTSLFDSAINFAQLKAAESILNMIDEKIQITNIIVQGDDVQCNVRTNLEGERLVAFTDLIGLEVNRKKMYISKNRTEFLRLTYRTDGDNQYKIFGYPARMIPTIFFGKPDDNERITLNSTIDQWQKFRRRCGLFNNRWLFEQMITDIFNKINTRNKSMGKSSLSKDDIISYIITHRSHDGYGEINNMNYKSNNNIIIEINKIDRPPDIEERSKKALELGLRYYDRNKLYTADITTFITNQMQWFGQKYVRYYEIKEIVKRKNIIVNHSKITNYEEALMLSRNLHDLSLGVKMKVDGITTTMSSAQLKEMLDIGRLKYEKEKEVSVISTSTLSRWLRSSKTFQQRVLEKNENVVINNTNIQGVTTNNLICYYNQLKFINSLINTQRWTSSLLTLCQLSCQEFLTDVTVSSTE